MIGQSVLPGRFRQSRLLLYTAAAVAAAAAAQALTKVYYLALPPGTACLLLSQ